jgi:Putative motility protein
MDISSASATAISAAQTSDAIGLAVQKMTLDSMKSQGSQLSALLGSVNSPSQGTHIDAWA